MADSYLGYQSPSTVDKKLDSESVVVGANTVERERVQITGRNAADIAPVDATNGLAVDNKTLPPGAATSAKQDTIIGYVDGIEALLTTIDGHIDQIEGYTDGIETLLNTIDGRVDGVEGLLTTLNGYVDQLEGYVDGIEANQATMIASLSAPSTIYNGKKTVTTAGTRVALASSQAVKSVTIKALSANTGVIYVGDSSVSSANGLQLLAGESISLDIANLNTVNLDSSVNGEGVTYIGVN
jgi:hypothetical protein